MATVGLCAGAAWSAIAGVRDYEFQLVQGEVKKGDGTIISVRLVNKGSGKAVAHHRRDRTQCRSVRRGHARSGAAAQAGVLGSLLDLVGRPAFKRIAGLFVGPRGPQ